MSETPDSIDVSLAELFVSALDEEGRSVPGLSQEDFMQTFKPFPLSGNQFVNPDHLFFQELAFHLHIQ